MQLLYDASDESPGRLGLGVLEGTVRRLPDGVKHPQMQWNRLEATEPTHRLLAGVEDAWMYFVHSYVTPMDDTMIATCEGARLAAEESGPGVAAVASDNVWAVQFHPEKSGLVGLDLLDNFVTSVQESQ